MPFPGIRESLPAALITAMWFSPALAQDENPTTPGAIPDPSTYQGSTVLQQQSDQQDQQFRQQQSQAQPSYQPSYPQPRSGAPSSGYTQRKAVAPSAPRPRPGATAFGNESSGYIAGETLNNRGDYAGAVGIWRPLAEKGDLNAQYNLGVNYELGHGVPKNDVMAAMWYRKAANRGYGAAMVNLAKVIADHARSSGELVPAYSWLMIAETHATHSSERADAQYNMGILRRVMSHDQIAQAESAARSWVPHSP